MTSQTKMTDEVKSLRHQLGVSLQNYRFSGKAKHWARAQECKSALEAIGAKSGHNG